MMIIPLHGFVHLWMIALAVIVGFALVIYSERTAKKSITVAMLVLYSAVYVYLTFLYRTPMAEMHMRLDPFWSYREAFDGFFTIRRLGVARSICLNILLYIPPGYLLPSVFRRCKHRFIVSAVAAAGLSLGTEAVQFFTKTGLCETDDVINNLIGAVIGGIGYWCAMKLMNRGHRA